MNAFIYINVLKSVAFTSAGVIPLLTAIYIRLVEWRCFTSFESAVTIVTVSQNTFLDIFLFKSILKCKVFCVGFEPTH